MSYTKTLVKESLRNSTNIIQDKSLEDNDTTLIWDYLNASMDISQNIMAQDKEIGILWNEIINDIIASIYMALSGFYRPGIVILRSVLEIGCNSIFYYDHKIEYNMFQQQNAKADKYVNTLVNEYSFFTTKYIAVFYSNIEVLQTCEDSVSNYLKKIYSNLSDNVHGRYETLTKTNEELAIVYDKGFFKRYEKLLFSTLSILAVLYILRFNDTSKITINRLANISEVIMI